ncbi:hypothetical protein [Fundidesulfovibrio terrae]|uniref:hypothetical protein n=1 Tax=Fundidesulfovibrio terrae TaxID=2922866 RepID=UPI001FAF1745|nr:hypothetical protein [Fundidesulfovibrio terrae]
MPVTKYPVLSLPPVLPALALLAALLVLPWPARAENKVDKTFDDWNTYTAMDGDDTVSATYTPDTQDKRCALYIGKFSSKCGTTLVSIGFPLNSKAEKDAERQNISGELRIDQFPVHTTNSRIANKAGATYGHFYVDSFSSPKTVIDEMSTGQMIRFRFKVGEREWYYRFSLKGFQPALARIAQLCSQGAPGQERKPHKPASEGASKPKSGKSDADYFDDKKPAAPNSSKSDKDFF